MYSYCVTAAPSGSTIGAAKCRLVKDSDQEYLVCVRRRSIYVYILNGLENDSADPNPNPDILDAPALAATIECYSTLVTFAVYRPPGSRQSHLLVVDSNYMLVLLTFDAQQKTFKTSVKVSLKEVPSQAIEGVPILKVDDTFKVIIFHGHWRIIKCIILSSQDYFDFGDVVSLHTIEANVLDIAFMTVEYNVQNDQPDGFGISTTSSSSHCKRLGETEQRKCPENFAMASLTCKLVFLLQDESCNGGRVNVAGRKLDGIKLFFEMETLGNTKRITSYACSSFFASAIPLMLPFSKLELLDLGGDESRGLLLLGSGGIGYLSFKNLKTIPIFHLDASISNVTCACALTLDSFLIADDWSNLYILQLYTEGTFTSGGLKRRVRSINSVPTHANVSSINVIKSAHVTKLGRFSVASALVKLKSNLVFLASATGTNCTIQIPLAESLDQTVQTVDETIEKLRGNRLAWGQTNLGPILDLALGPRNGIGARLMLASCGFGQSGKLVSMSLGIGLTDSASTSMAGVLKLSSAKIDSPNPLVIFACSYYQSTRFFSISCNYSNKDDWVISKEASGGFLNPVRVEPLKNLNLSQDKRTILFTRIAPNTLLQVTTDDARIVTVGAALGDYCSSVVTAALSTEQLGRLLQQPASRITLARILKTRLIVVLADYTVAVFCVKNGFTLIKSHTKLSVHVSTIACFTWGGIDYVGLTTWEGCMLFISPLDSIDETFGLGHSIPAHAGVAILSLEFGSLDGKLYAFIACSDGKLLVYSVQIGTTNVLELENMIQGTGTPIGIGVVNHKACESFSNLKHTSIVTTGSHSMVIFGHLDRLEYMPSVSNLKLICTLEIPAFGNGVHVLYYTNDQQLHIGTMDTSEKLQVNTLAKGRSFDHLSFSKVQNIAMVGCPSELVISSKCGDEMEIDFMCLDTNGVNKDFGGFRIPAVARFINTQTNEVIYDLQVASGHTVSSSCICTLDGVEYFAFGTSKVLDSESVPSRGYIYLVEICQNVNTDCFSIKAQATIEPFPGGIVAMQGTRDHLIVGINHKVVAFKLASVNECTNTRNDVNYTRLRHLFASDASGSMASLEKIGEYVSNTFVVSINVHEDLILIGDLMTSVRLLHLTKNGLVEIARDFNYLWPTACTILDRDTYLVSDGDGAFTLLRRPHQASDVQCIMLDEQGYFVHGEVVNKIKVLEPRDETKQTRKTMVEIKGNVCNRQACTCKLQAPLEGFDFIYKDPGFSKILLCATSSGSIMQVCLFKSEEMFIRLALLEEAMVKHLGEIHHDSAKMGKQGRGFINGNLVERFLVLSAEEKRRVFSLVQNNKDIGYDCMDHLIFELQKLVRTRTIEIT
ncbi:bifunctional WD40-repeat-containing domain superfamily/WD40-YVTN repeat-like-containing domain superfamily/Cleavage-polyadenylation specificity factor [Babesia duncani]|uniref:Bifunctional WD40-repeat-containing domain superfamily/WD40-YVTN repeat-like-containing domain superfamily/Cleavage-polyadenylation specificity factor n=1 Tax=Babesia duncani TaxID=323732 RepID=A0AAD9PM62_9APIC|nr:bifunctional WD40-repeat-containing domain superfamily/WD40-YVTN repeat-like-containing domain superfamily/Cleavage-polyadenylation specificity factor [Babesia duncani]